MLDALLVAVHVPAGMVAVISGAGAMLAEKGGRAHRRRGRAYLVALAVVSLTGIGLAQTRWPRFPHLLVLGLVAGAFATAGYVSRRGKDPSVHLVSMGVSYVAMLTAFYVDNGPTLPLWNQLPPIVFWFLPTILAFPLIVRAVHRYGRRVS